MKNFSILTVVCLFLNTFFTINVSAQTSTNITLQAQSPTSICSTGKDTVSFSLSASGVPSNTNIVIYQSKDSTFNPYAGQGDSISFIQGINIPKDTVNFGKCVKILGIFIDACGAVGLESKNEYMILTSGSGIKVSNLAIAYDPANSNSGKNNDNSINTGTAPCGFKTPTPSLIAGLRVGSCNAANIIPASSSDSIPPNAIILLFTSDSVTVNYNVNGLCNLGYPIYVIQSSCARTIGAFTNAANCSTNPTTRYRKTTAFDKRQNCQDRFVYDRCGLFDKDGTYAIRQQGTDTASVANNGIRRNMIDTCGGIEYNQLKFTTDTILKFAIPVSYCNKGFNYIKAITHPNGAQPISNTVKYQLVCNDVNASTKTTNICSGDAVEIAISSTDKLATLGWTVNGGNNITGAISGTGNSINQTLTNNGTNKDSVTYMVTSTDAGCVKTQPVKVIVNNIPQVNISGEQEICNGSSTVIMVAGQYDSVRWNTGAYGNQLQVATAGTYTATAYLNGCSGSARYKISNCEQQICNPTITGNKTFCQGDSIILDAGAGFNTYLWNNGAVTQTIKVKSAGKYIVTVSGTNCNGIDSVMVNTNTIPSVSIIGKTNLCPDARITLTAEADVDSVRWSNGSSNQSIIVTEPQQYTVTVYSNGCSNSASVTVTQQTPPAKFNLGNDTTYCNEFSRILSTGISTTEWSTDVTSSQITITTAGTYIATIRNECGATSDTIVITKSRNPEINLGEDIAMCDSVINLSAPSEMESYLWSNGIKRSETTVKDPGVYWVKITNIDGCSASDTITITSNCKNDIWVPNAFTPNKDGINDVFMVRSNGNTTVEKFLVYNRWGIKVFEATDVKTNDPTFGWDGTYKGEPVQAEVYSYYIVVKFGNGDKKTLKGNITLLK